MAIELTFKNLRNCKIWGLSKTIPKRSSIDAGGGGEEGGEEEEGEGGEGAEGAEGGEGEIGEGSRDLQKPAP